MSNYGEVPGKRDSVSELVTAREWQKTETARTEASGVTVRFPAVSILLFNIQCGLTLALRVQV
jgi:hypothetical protein